MLFSFSKRQLPLKRFPYLPLSGELPYEGGEKGFLKSPSSLRVCLPIAEIPLTNRFCLERLFLILFTYKLKVTSHCSQHLRGPRVDSLISEAQPSSEDPKFINCEVSTSASLFFLVEMRNSKRKANGLRNPVSYNIGFLLQSRGEETGEERGSWLHPRILPAFRTATRGAHGRSRRTGTANVPIPGLLFFLSFFT